MLFGMLAGPRALRRSDRRRLGSSTSPWRARDVRVAPACDDGAGHWLSELDPEGEIAGLPAVVREEQIGGSAAWPDDYIVVRGWSEGTALLYEAIQEADDEDRVKAAFQARLETRREDWALRMQSSAHVLKGSGNVDSRNFAGTAMALLHGRAL